MMTSAAEAQWLKLLSRAPILTETRRSLLLDGEEQLEL